MPNIIFNSLFHERVDVFRAAFSATSTEIFYDPQTKRLRHTGEYGMFRETIVRDFLRFFIPHSLDISTGFVITSMDDVSTQCDIIVFDPKITPLYQEGDRHRFFPVETAYCVGEVKSSLTRTELKEALNKLAGVKALGERISHPVVRRRDSPGPFDPTGYPYDALPSILLCQKLNFNLSNLENEIDALYEPNILHRHKHNMILSIEDGILVYCDDNNVMLPYPELDRKALKHTFLLSSMKKYAHFRPFGSYMFMMTVSRTSLYPEFSDYLVQSNASTRRNQRE